MSDSVSQQDADQVDAGLFRRGGGRRDPPPPLEPPTGGNPAPKLAEYQMNHPKRGLCLIFNQLWILTSGAGASGAGASDAGALVLAPLLAPLVLALWRWRLWCWRLWWLRLWSAPLCWRLLAAGASVVLAPLVLAPLVLAPLVLAPLLWCWRLCAGASGAAPLVLALWCWRLVLAPLVLAPLVLAPLVLAPLVLAPLVLAAPSGAGASGAGAAGALVLASAGASGAGASGAGASVLAPLVLAPLVLAPLVLAPLTLQQFSVKVTFDPRTGQSTRIGSDVDADNLEGSAVSNSSASPSCRFAISAAKKIVSVIKETARKDHSNYDCVAVVLLSHGENGAIYGSDGKIKNGEALPPAAARLLPHSGWQAEAACRGSEYDKGCEVADGDNGTGRDEEDGGKLSRIPLESDFLYFYSTPPGYYSWRNDIQGSWFIQQLCHVLQRYGDSDELGHLLLMVQQAVAGNYQSNTNDDSTSGMKEIPVSVSTLRKLVYFRRNAEREKLLFCIDWQKASAKKEGRICFRLRAANMREIGRRVGRPGGATD
uniref:CASPASE_P20 domain-containing protein n=1 Tax=Macrostomum lignano TaxID=282301 RepID=A0A1I8IVI9_9PLAT